MPAEGFDWELRVILWSNPHCRSTSEGNEPAVSSDRSFGNEPNPPLSKCKCPRALMGNSCKIAAFQEPPGEPDCGVEKRYRRRFKLSTACLDQIPTIRKAHPHLHHHIRQERLADPKQLGIRWFNALGMNALQVARTRPWRRSAGPDQPPNAPSLPDADAPKPWNPPLSSKSNPG
jgi:hypothetical protein